jgi:hypothetical protein
MLVLIFLEGVAGCEDTQFTCADGSCINLSSLCDDWDDCPDKEDESNCGKT